MERIQKQIDAFLERAEIIKADMRRHVPGLLVVDQVNESLIFVSPKRSYIYEMDYVDNYVNRAAGIPTGTLLWHDYLLKPLRECRREDNPELFLEILKCSMKTVEKRAYEIYADGKHLKRTLTFGRALRFVYALKRVARNPMDERYQSFKNLARVWVVDPAGNKTWFILDPRYANYNMDYHR
jgi:hypothetical protein